MSRQSLPQTSPSVTLIQIRYEFYNSFKEEWYEDVRLQVGSSMGRSLVENSMGPRTWSLHTQLLSLFASCLDSMTKPHQLYFRNIARNWALSTYTAITLVQILFSIFYLQALSHKFFCHRIPYSSWLPTPSHFPQCS